jgi:hypothetical protein
MKKNNSHAEPVEADFFYKHHEVILLRRAFS